MIPLAVQHRAAAHLCDTFPTAAFYISTSADGIAVQVCAHDNGSPQQRVALVQTISAAVNAGPLDVAPTTKGARYECQSGRFAGVPVVSVYTALTAEERQDLDDADSVARSEHAERAAGRATNKAFAQVNETPPGSVSTAATRAVSFRPPHLTLAQDITVELGGDGAA